MASVRHIASATHHVHRRTAQRGRHVAVLQEACKTKVGNFQRNLGRIGQLAAATVVQQDVLRLQVAVHDALGEQGAHGAGQLTQEQADGVLAECALHVQVVGEIAAIAVLEFGMRRTIECGTIQMYSTNSYAFLEKQVKVV